MLLVVRAIIAVSWLKSLTRISWPLTCLRIQSFLRHVKNPQKNVAWFVGDLAQLPLREHSIDVILDIFSPANYQEFGRLLSDYGLVFKVIPHEDHLKEFRQLLPEAQAYSNQDVLEHFQESCDLLERVTIAKTWSMPSEHVQTFAEMTPLFSMPIRRLWT